MSEVQKRNISENRLIITQEKTKEPVYVPLSPQAMEYLPDVSDLKSDSLLFPPPARSTILTNIREWAAHAGISKKVTFHTSRHTFATLAITYGIDIAVASELLGHTDIKTTQIYAKIIDEKKNEAVNKLPKL